MKENLIDILDKEELLALRLRRLYEQNGYGKFRMSKFEEYDFYAQNKDFLSSAQLISFTDLDGKLMALRPDVTLSIAKNARGENREEKLYYTENVYRASPECSEYREIFQIGVERIGSDASAADAEMVKLGICSLKCIDAGAILELSHMGYVDGLLKEIASDQEQYRQLVGMIESKSRHSIEALPQRQLGAEGKRLVCGLIGLSGAAEETLKRASKMAVSERMRLAVSELEDIALQISSEEYKNDIRLDFSITSNAKYYNGLMLRGYVLGMPAPVLSGGRYDPLLLSMGKEQKGIGFAIYFDGLGRYLSGREEENA